MMRKTNRWRCPLALMLIMALGLLSTTGCGGEDTTGRQGAKGQTADDRSEWPEVIRFGLVPTEGGADTTERFKPLEKLLGDELGVKVQVVSASSYQGVITAMANDQLEFAWFGPKSYVEAARRADAEALLLERNKAGEEGYRCIFIVPADSPIRSLEDAKGKRFAFTDPNSASGCLIPSIELIGKVKMPAEEYFSEVVYSGAHSTSALQVANGEIDIAATNDLDFAKLIESNKLSKDRVRVVHTSELIPGAPLAARRELPDSLKQAFIKAMLKVNDRPELMEKFQNGGYVPVDDTAYDIIRQAEDYLAQKKKEG